MNTLPSLGDDEKKDYDDNQRKEAKKQYKKKKNKRLSSESPSRDPKRNKTSNASNTEKKKNPIILFERWDVDKLIHISELVLKSEVERGVAEVLRQFRENIHKGYSHLRTHYEPSCDFREGRLYAGSAGLQTIPSWIRRICSVEYYHDVDMSNAAPRILAQIVKKYVREDEQHKYKLLFKYAKNRDGVFAEVKQSLPTDHPFRSKDKPLKTLFLKVLHGGKCTDEQSRLMPLVSEFEDTCKRVFQTLKDHSHFNEIYQEVAQNQKKTNKIGTFLARVWQREENRILRALKEFFENKEGKFEHVPCDVGVLVFDGLMVKRRLEGSKEGLDLGLLEKAKNYAERKTGFSMPLVEKPLTPTVEDWDKFNGIKAIHKIRCDKRKCVETVLQSAHEKNYKRLDDDVMKKHATIPGVHLKHKELKDFVAEVLKDKIFFHKIKIPELTDMLKGKDYHKFPLLKDSQMRLDVVSFIDGYYDTTRMRFTPWSDLLEGEKPPLTNWFFEKKHEEVHNKETPLWNKLISTQLEEPEVFEMFEVMVGRLFYPIQTHDNWQVMPFLKGDANTGKGTVAEVIIAMLPSNQVGCIDSSRQKKFGLESLVSKRLVMFPDAPPNLHETLNQQLFQSMVTGEMVTITKKHKKAEEVRWTIPMMMCANFMMKYRDEKGSFSRRIVVFVFEKLVQCRDTKLKQKIVDKELATVLLRCLESYRKHVNCLGDKDFEKNLPLKVRQMRDDVKEQTCPMTNFLINGDEHYQIIFEKGALLPFTKFQKAFTNHMNFTQSIHGSHKIQDCYPLKSRDFITSWHNLCKVCEKKSNKQNCGDHYNASNRRKMKVIHNMVLKKRQ